MQSPAPTFVEQVGGNHYQADYQHWDLVADLNIAYLEATATKYVGRWRKKNYHEDLKKAISYIDKKIATLENPSSYSHAVGNIGHYRGFPVSPIQMMNWFESANLSQWDRRVCTLILAWETIDQLKEARDVIQNAVDTNDYFPSWPENKDDKAF